MCSNVKLFYRYSPSPVYKEEESAIVDSTKGELVDNEQVSTIEVEEE